MTDGKRPLGGMMIGDVSDFMKLVAIVKKKARFIFSTASEASMTGSS